MSVIAELIRAGVDADLVGRVAEAIAEARAMGTMQQHSERTRRQERNARYYEKRSSEIKKFKTDSDAFKTDSDATTPRAVIPPAHTHASAPVCSNGSSLRSEPISLEEKPNPSGLSKAERRTASRKHSLAEDAQPTEPDKRLADEAGLSPVEFRDEWRAFRDYHCSRGNLMKNWHLAWSTWLRNSKRFKPRAGPSGAQKYRNGHMELAINQMKDDFDAIDGNSNGKPVFDVEVFLGKKPREARPGPYGSPLDAGHDAEAGGELDFSGCD